MGTDDFFQTPRDWTKYKHDVLRKYLSIWASKLGSAHDRLVFVDTCAGAGTYDDGTPGSPLIAAKINDRHAWASQGKSLLVIACEANRDNYSKLKAALDPYAIRTPPQALTAFGSYIEHLRAIAERTRNVPTFFFIDPYGMVALTANNLAPLLKDYARESTEVLVRVPAQLLARLAGQLHSTHSRAAAFRKLLEKLGINDVLLNRAEEDIPVSQAELFDSYLDIFHNSFEYVTPIAIRPDYFAAPKYYLVHSTNSPHGLICMNDVVSTVEDDLFKDTSDHLDGAQVPMFEAQRQPRVSLKDAARAMEQYLANQPRRSAQWLSVRAHLVQELGMGELREKDHDAALKLLAGKLEETKTAKNKLYRTFRLP